MYYFPNQITKRELFLPWLLSVIGEVVHCPKSANQGDEWEPKSSSGSARQHMCPGMGLHLLREKGNFSNDHKGTVTYQVV